MIILDGSEGEGGGQILRSALSLSILTATPFRIVNIRAKRSKPGLLRQHLTAVQAAATISNAKVTGNSLGSDMIEFIPDTVDGGKYHFAIGTAGSTSLVLQTILMPLLFADEDSEITITGGTHAKFAPAFEFVANAYVPLINAMGANITLTLQRHGFYPRGGGQVTARIERLQKLQPITLIDRGALLNQTAHAIVAAVPGKVASRELGVVQRRLSIGEKDCQIQTLNPDMGPGNALVVTTTHQSVTEVFTEYGDRGVSAETVAKRVCGQANNYLKSDAAVGTYLADQLLLPMAIAGSGKFTTMTPSLHFRTNADVIHQFTGKSVCVREGDASNLIEVAR